MRDRERPCRQTMCSMYTAFVSGLDEGLLGVDKTSYSYLTHAWPAAAEDSFRVQLNSLAHQTKPLFTCKKILNFATVALSFVCGKYYPIMD
jgi:hypothetical protein